MPEIRVRYEMKVRSGLQIGLMSQDLANETHVIVCMDHQCNYYLHREQDTAVENKLNGRKIHFTWRRNKRLE